MRRRRYPQQHFCPPKVLCTVPRWAAFSRTLQEVHGVSTVFLWNIRSLSMVMHTYLCVDIKKIKSHRAMMCRSLCIDNNYILKKQKTYIHTHRHVNQPCSHTLYPPWDAFWKRPWSSSLGRLWRPEAKDRSWSEFPMRPTVLEGWKNFLPDEIGIEWEIREICWIL